MAVKHSKGSKTAVIHTPAEQAHRMWLAGLGVLALAHKRGSEWFARFVDEGKELQTRSTTFARETATDLQAQATGIFSPLTARIEKQATQYAVALEHGMERVLATLGIPAKRDVEALSNQIAALTRKLKTAK